MKFVKKEVMLHNEKYKIYQAKDIPQQYRCINIPKSCTWILGNASAYKFIRDIALIVANPVYKNEIFLIEDKSKISEKLKKRYNGAEGNQKVVMVNYAKTHLSRKKLKRLIAMCKYVKAEEVNINIPRYEYDTIPHWELDNKLSVKIQGKFTMLSTDNIGYLYIAREAEKFTDIEDDTQEYFAHGHLFHLTRDEDKVNLGYNFEA